MTRKTLRRILQKIAPGIKTAIDTAVAAKSVERSVEIADLRDRLTALEARNEVITLDGLLIDRGVYQHDRPYAKGDVVTHAGSLWIAQEATSAVPGGRGDNVPARAWRLARKRDR
jgi:hypothetical protein